MHLFRKALAFTIILAIALQLCACMLHTFDSSYPWKNPTEAFSSPITHQSRPTEEATHPTPIQQAPTQPAPEVNLFEGYYLPMHRTFYTQLTKNEQYVYEQLRACVINDTYTCVLQQVNYNEFIPILERAAYALYADFPEFFWISYAILYKTLANGPVGNLEITLNCNVYWYDVGNHRLYVKTFMDNAIEISGYVMDAYSTDFERLRYLHDFLTTNVTYDHASAAMNGRPDQTEENVQARSAYGALVRRTAVCEGYAKAYKLIANLCGYDCEYVSGTAGEPHSWNYFTLNGNSYWVDVTWDDTDNTASPASRSYAYFGITTERLRLTHTPSEKYFPLPECTDTTYDFFHYTGSHFTQYDFESINTAASKQVFYGMCVNLRFDSRAALDAAVNDLFGANQRHTQLQLQGKQVVSYSINKTHNTLLLSLQH